MPHPSKSFDQAFKKISSTATGPILAPMRYGVKNVQFQSFFPGSEDAIWAADVQMCRANEGIVEFEGILFMEQEGNAAVFGVEEEDGCPRNINADRAKIQQEFIHFLRQETKRKNDAVGVMAQLFDGYEYSQLGWVTAAYIIARGVKLNMGVGYHNDETEIYELFQLHSDLGNEWIKNQKMLGIN